MNCTYSNPAAAVLVEIDTLTLKLQAGKQFDYESGLTAFDVTCDATDGYLTTSLTFTVNIQDTNDPPVFAAPSYSTSVGEGRTVNPGFVVQDEPGDKHVYSIVPGPDSGLFSINASTGEITTTADLDALSVASKTYTLTVEVADQDSAKSQTNLTVVVNDINDNAPVFDQTSYQTTTTIGKGTPVNTVLGNVSATDQDFGTNGNIQYSLVTGANSDYFAVDPNDGTIRLTKTMDLSHSTAITLTVSATDQGTPALSSTVLVSVMWNSPPDITNLPGQANIHEDVAGKADIMVLVVQDAENDTITCNQGGIDPSTTAFDVVPNPSPPGFKVEYTGLQTLDSTTNPQYVLTVKCEDDQGGSESQNLTIKVNPNSAPNPNCGPTPAIVLDAQTHPLGSDVYSLTSTDPENDTLEYNIATCTPTPCPFSLGQYDGKFTTNVDLRSDSQIQYEVDIEVKDPKHTATCKMIFRLQNLNQAPTFSSQSDVDIPEDVPAGSNIATLAVTDPNPADNVTTTCSYNDSAAAGLVEVVGTTLKLQAGKQFDFESGPTSFSVTCVASDGFQTDTLTFIVNILDSNDPPVFDKTSYSISIPEGGTGDPNFMVIDDAGDSPTYSILPGPDSAFFTIDSSGKITTTADIDPNKASKTYTLTVQVSDSHGATNTTTVTVEVTDANDNDPEFLPTSYETIKIGKKTAVNGLLTTVTATDKDFGSNSDIQYSLSGNYNDYFSINPANGEIRLNKAMDLPHNTPITLTVTATDQGNQTRSSTALVSVLWNTPPEITNLPAQTDIHEDAAAKDMITLAVTDAESDTIFCSKVGSNPSTTAFDVTQTGSNFKIAYTPSPKLDSSTVSQYTVSVKCEDDEGGSETKDYIIKVLPNEPPVPDCVPIAQVAVDASTTSITPKPKTVHTITTTDPENDPIEYSASCTPAPCPFVLGKYDGKFTNTVDLLQQGIQAQYEAAVTVKDLKNTVTCTVVFNIDNLNDKPVLDNIQVKLEDEVIGPLGVDTEVMTFDITNQFSCPNPSPLTLTHTVTPPGDFRLDVTGNTVSVKAKAGSVLDYESVNKYTFVFDGTDGCWAADSISAVLTLNDVNEPPVMTGGNKYTVELTENQQTGVDLNCGVSDVDNPDTLTWTVTPPAMNDFFYVTDAAKCTIGLKKEYDLDLPNAVGFRTFPITIQAKDKNNEMATATVDVTIKEENDNAPEFDQLAYTFDVFAGTAPGANIGTVNANDIDFDIHGEVTYSIESAVDGCGSYVDIREDGVVTLEKSMDGVFHEGRVCNFIIKAEDGGNPAKVGYAKMDIQYKPQPPPQPPAPQNPGTIATPTSTDSGSIWNNPAIIALLAVGGAALLGLLGLTGYLLASRFCFSKTPTNPTNLTGYKPTPRPPPPDRNLNAKPEKTKEKPKKTEKPKKKEKEIKRPPTPEEHPVTPSSVRIIHTPPKSNAMFEPYKETFNDLDYAVDPDRFGMPKPVS